MAGAFAVFGNMCTFAAEHQNVMLVNYYITQARGEEMMPSGSHVCLVTSKSHYSCHF